jgi:hypothetical protein
VRGWAVWVYAPSAPYTRCRPILSALAILVALTRRYVGHTMIVNCST